MLFSCHFQCHSAEKSPHMINPLSAQYPRVLLRCSFVNCLMKASRIASKATSLWSSIRVGSPLHCNFVAWIWRAFWNLLIEYLTLSLCSAEWDSRTSDKFKKPCNRAKRNPGQVLMARKMSDEGHDSRKRALGTRLATHIETRFSVMDTVLTSVQQWADPRAELRK